MADYDNVITRTDAAALIPTDVSREILEGAAEDSVVMRLATRGQDMSAKVRSQPVLDSLPTAYFVNGDTGLKKTTDVTWGKKELVAEELAVIVPIPEAVLDDAAYDIWAAIKPRIREAFGLKFDRAVLYGDGAPTSWPDSLLTGATAAGNVVDYSSVTGAATPGDIYDAVLGPTGVISTLEADGYMANGHVAAMSMRGTLRGLRDDAGRPIFATDMQGAGNYMLDGEPIYFPRNGAIDPTRSLMFSADWTKVIYAIRQDLTYKVLDQAVIQDDTGAIVYNLAQQDKLQA